MQNHYKQTPKKVLPTFDPKEFDRNEMRLTLNLIATANLGILNGEPLSVQRKNVKHFCNMEVTVDNLHRIEGGDKDCFAIPIGNVVIDYFSQAGIEPIGRLIREEEMTLGRSKMMVTYPSETITKVLYDPKDLAIINHLIIEKIVSGI